MIVGLKSTSEKGLLKISQVQTNKIQNPTDWIQKCWIMSEDVLRVGRKQVSPTIKFGLLSEALDFNSSALESGLSAEWILKVPSIPNVHHSYSTAFWQRDFSGDAEPGCYSKIHVREKYVLSTFMVRKDAKSYLLHQSRYSTKKDFWNFIFNGIFYLEC